MRSNEDNASSVNTGSRRRWSRRTLLFFAWCVVPLLLLLLAETALRAAGYGRDMSPLIPLDCPDERVFAINRDFYHQFMGEELDDIGTDPPDVVIPQAKAANTYRVVVLGGSAAQGWIDSGHGFWRILGKMLSHAFPQQDIEVYCLARHGMNSPVMRRITTECAAIEPDCFVVYLGHNEVVGPFGLFTGLGRTELPPSALNKLVQTWIRLGNWRLLQAAGLAAGQQDMDTMLGFGWGHTAPVENLQDPRLARVHQQFEMNLRAICRMAEELGADVFLSELVRNLADIPPAVSLHAPTLSEDALPAWKELYEQGVAAQDAGEYRNALSAFREAGEFDDAHAELHFRMAQCALALGDVETARTHFEAAAERDAGLGAGTRELNARIRQVAAENSGGNTYLVEPDARFATGTRHGLPDKTLFYDRIHFRFEGNYRLARCFFEKLAPIIAQKTAPDRNVPAALSAEETRRHIAYSPVEELTTLENALPVLERQPDYPVAHLRERAETLRAQVGGNAAALRLDAYARGLEHDPDDLFLRLRYVDALGLAGRMAEALAAARRAAETHPCSWPAQQVLALTLDQVGLDQEAAATLAGVMPLYGDYVNAQRAYAQRCWNAEQEAVAIAALKHALALKPAHIAARLDLADLYALQGRFEEALPLCEAVLAQQSEHSRAHLLRGKALAGLGQYGDAQQAFEAAINALPNNPAAYTELGLMLMKREQWAEARPVLQKAVALRQRRGDNGPATRIALVQTLCALNEVEAARRALDEAERRGVSVPLQARTCLNPPGPGTPAQ